MADLTLELRGPSGEPVSFARTLISHGVGSLAPNEIDENASTLKTVLSTSGSRPQRFVIREVTPGVAAISGGDARVLPIVRRMLNLDEDLSEFYALAADDPDLAWATDGAGRMLRSPTVFEDVVKTICTTNCAWSGTERMTSALVRELGGGVFPTPEQMAEAGETFYRDVVRAGYRGPYLHSLARDVAGGVTDLESLLDPELPDEEVAQRLLALSGVGPYAAAHVMMLLGRYSRLVLDSWTRPTYDRLRGRRAVKDITIERRFRRYRRFAGLAFWLYLTRHWLQEPATTKTAP